MSLLDWERIKELGFTDNFEKLSRRELGKIKIEIQKEDEFKTLLYFLVLSRYYFDYDSVTYL